MGSLVYFSLSCGGIKNKIDDSILMRFYVFLYAFIWASGPNIKMILYILLILY
jgi:hypothetical protein